MKYRRAPALAGALLLLSVVAAIVSPESRLAVLDQSGEWRLVSSALTLRYRHSVEQTIVEEDFLPSSVGVRVIEMRFASFGAGLPSQPEWGGRFDSDAAGRLAVRGMTAVLPEVRIRVGHVSEQAFVGNGTAVLLNSLVEPGGVMTVQSITRPRLFWWSWR